MTGRTAGVVATVVALLVATVLIGSQFLANTGSPAQRANVPSTASDPELLDDDDDEECADADDAACGNEHARAVRAWVSCKAEKGKDACTKPIPPGKALGHTMHAGKASGRASADGQGHGWGRAHAPGQLKTKTKTKSDVDQADDGPAN
jgi:hypothetical protein